MENSDNPRKQPLTNPYTKNEIVNRLILGENSKSIAKDYNCSDARIRQIRKENKELINLMAEKLVKENLEDISKTIRNDVQIGKRISEKALKDVETVTDKELEYKKTHNRTNENLLRSVGIFPAQHPSFVFNQYNDNRQQTQIISPNVLDMFASHAKSLIDNGKDDEENSDIEKW